MFNEIDTDKSGLLEFDEIYQLFNCSGLSISKSQIKDLFFDKNNNKLSLDEFLKVSKDPFYRVKFRKIMRKIKREMKLSRYKLL